MMKDSSTLYFNSPKQAGQFGRKLKLKTQARNIVWSRYKVTVPNQYIEEARSLYIELGNEIAKHSVNVGAFGATLLQLLGEVRTSDGYEELVLEAFRRSTTTLENASPEEIAEYLSGMSPEALAGTINNVKGIYHEYKFEAAENADGDEWQASLMPDTNYPGADIVLHNNLTGESVEIQLKATDSIAYLSEHFQRYPDTPLYATTEVAKKHAEAQSSGISNTQISEDVSETTTSLIEETPVEAGPAVLLEDTMKGGIIGAAISEGIQAFYAAKKGERFAFDQQRLIQAAKRSALLALATGIIT